MFDWIMCDIDHAGFIHLLRKAGQDDCLQIECSPIAICNGIRLQTCEQIPSISSFADGSDKSSAASDLLEGIGSSLLQILFPLLLDGSFLLLYCFGLGRCLDNTLKFHHWGISIQADDPKPSICLFSLISSFSICRDPA